MSAVASIPAKPPASPYVMLGHDVTQLGAAIRASGVRVDALGATSTRRQIAIAKAEARGLADLAFRWLAAVERAEG